MLPNLELWVRILLAIAIAFAISFAATPVVKSFATKMGAIDVPDGKRRVHDHPIPRMGGLAIFLGFLLSVVLFADITRQVRGVLLGAVLIVACGAIDDVVNLRAWIKLLVQIAAAVIAVAHGVVIEFFSNPNIFSPYELLNLGWLAIPVTVLWIVGITNSVNLIDGLDGLAVGVSTIASTTMFVVALLVSEGNVALLLAALMGACIGFMPYNLNPAKIFMGDTGALLLGYVLSTVSVVGMFKTYALVTFVVPMLALFLYDTWEEAMEIARANLAVEGMGHSVVIHSNTQAHIEAVPAVVNVSRYAVNQVGGTALGGAMDNGLNPTTTLGCGTWGNNIISENLWYTHLMNVSRISYKVPSMYVPSDEEIWAE